MTRIQRAYRKDAPCPSAKPTRANRRSIGSAGDSRRTEVRIAIVAKSDGPSGVVISFFVATAAAVVAGIILALIHLGTGSSGPASPSDGSSSSGGTTTKPRPNPSPTAYTLLWNQSVELSHSGSDGVVFQQNGAVPIPNVGEIMYDVEWTSLSGSLNIWNYRSMPSPSDCADQQGVNTANSTISAIGDRYCYVNTKSPGGPIVVAITVTGIPQNGIIFDARAWAPKS